MSIDRETNTEQADVDDFRWEDSELVAKGLRDLRFVLSWPGQIVIWISLIGVLAFVVALVLELMD